MAARIDVSAIRSSCPHQVAQYFQKARAELSEQGITLQLLQHVGRGSLPPSSFAIWLGIASAPATVYEALKQNISVEVRKLGIKRLRKHLASSAWKETWDILGGTQGLLQLLGNFSVLEVRDVCHAIACSAKGEERDKKRAAITELLKALLSRFLPNSKFQNVEQRRVRKHYQRLVPGCTPEFVKDIYTGNVEGVKGDVPKRSLLQSHYETLWDFVQWNIFNDTPCGAEWRDDLLRRYPSDTSDERGFSLSMQFSLLILRRSTEEESPAISKEWFIKQLVEPLLKRAIRKKAELLKIQEIVDLAITYVDRHPALAKEIRCAHGGLLHLVALCWSRRSEMFENQFSTLLVLSHKRFKSVEIGCFEPLMNGMPRSHRYPLLRFCLKETTGRDLDVEADLNGVNGILKYSLLERLKTDQALRLFATLRAGRGDHGLVEIAPHFSILNITPSFTDCTGDPEMYHIVLLYRAGYQEKAKELSERCLQARQKKAASCSDRSERAFYAKSALFYAISSGSLKIYKGSLAWARRFIRDPIVVAELYQHYPNEAKELLSGIPEVVDPSATLLTLRSRVEEANQILRGFFDTVCLALREPSFAHHHWHGTLALFGYVVQARILHSSNLRKTLNLSDDEVYDSLWKDTLSTLIDAEEKGLKAGYEKLGVSSLYGIMQYENSPPIECKCDSTEISVYRFLDELAKARDELWRRYRLTIHPAAAALPQPFPRGLALQYLTTPYNMVHPNLEIVAPYLASRMRAAIFLDPSAALAPIPDDEDNWAAIGCFVDDYEYALQLFLPKEMKYDEKRKRIDHAWAHAINSLSGSRMSPEEANRYWAWISDSQFVEYWSSAERTGGCSDDWPIVPPVDDPNKIEEWSPIPPATLNIRPRCLTQLTYADLSKAIGRRTAYQPDIRSTLDRFTAVVPGKEFQVNDIWSLARARRGKTRSAIREGQILSALLFLDSRNSAQTRLFSAPFPSTYHCRYPSLYLDEQFLSQADLTPNAAIQALKIHLKWVPSCLLADLTMNTLNSLELAESKGSDYIDQESLAFHLLQLLAKSDKPGLASTLIVRTIIQRPDASSWHRHLLSPSFLRRLPVSDAYACLSEFADVIITTLGDRMAAREARKIEGTSAERTGSMNIEEPQALAKITTVKLLAELLRDTELVPEEFSFDVLSKLLEKTSHMDTRVAVTKSLLSMLCDWEAKQMSEKIYATLERLVPIAGNLDERNPILEPKWNRAKEAGELPEVDFGFSISSAPILDTLLGFLCCQWMPNEHGIKFTKRIILPILTSLKKQTSRYSVIFLRNYGMNDEAMQDIHIPPVPRTIAIWNCIIQNGPTHFFPSALVEEYNTYMIFNVAPPALIQVFNKKLKDNPALSSRLDVRNWLALYDKGLSVINYTNQFDLNSLLYKDTELPEGGITPRVCQEQFLKLFTALLWNDGPRLKHIEILVYQFDINVYKEHWGKHVKPTMEAAILYVDTLRTREWDRDPDRQPKVLPDTFPLRLKLLPYLADGHGYNNEVRKQKCKSYADQLAGILDKITGSLYHKKLEQIKQVLKSMTVENRILVASHLGDIKKTRLSWLTMQDQLRVELAVHLLSDNQDPDDDELKAKVEDMLESWKRSENEEVRRFGLLTEGESIPM